MPEHLFRPPNPELPKKLPFAYTVQLAETDEFDGMKPIFDRLTQLDPGSSVTRHGLNTVLVTFTISTGNTEQIVGAKEILTLLQGTGDSSRNVQPIALFE